MHIVIAFVVFTAIAFVPLWMLNALAGAANNASSRRVALEALLFAAIIGAIAALVFAGIWSVAAPLVTGRL